MRIVRILAVWTLQIVIGGLFVMLGVMKFQDPSWARNFARWGYPDGFHMVVGVIEALGGVAMQEVSDRGSPPTRHWFSWRRWPAPRSLTSCMASCTGFPYHSCFCC